VPEMEETRCITMTRKNNIVLALLSLVTICFIVSDAFAEVWPVGKYPLSFGFHNMLTNTQNYTRMFETCLNNGITVHSVEFEWREDRIKGMYYWGRSDSIVIAAHDAMEKTGVLIELRGRFQDICSPQWAPYPDPVISQSGNFPIVRNSEYEYYPEMLDYLELFLERYKPGGILAQQMNWGSEWGITHYDVFGEYDRCWHAVGDYGNHIAPSSMHLDEFAVLYSDYRETLQAIYQDVSIPFSTLSTPFDEFECENQVGIQSEAEYISFVIIVRHELEDVLNKPPIDEFDWHTFILYNDPLNPGIYNPQPHWNWGEKSFSDRSHLISDVLFSDVDIPISTFEGAATPYWNNIKYVGVEMNHRNHIIFQLSSLAELSVGGATRVLVFDSTIDDGVSADFGYTAFEEWWNNTEDPADSLFDAYSRMAELLAGSYCTAKYVEDSIDPIIRFCYYSPGKALYTYMIRAKYDSGAHTAYSFAVNTSLVRVYRMLDDPYLVECPGGICELGAGLNWDIVWVEEVSSDEERQMYDDSGIQVAGPNPSCNSARFIISSEMSKAENISIYDICGRCIASIPIFKRNGVRNAVLNLSEYSEGGGVLPNGTYYAICAEYPENIARFTVVR